MICGKETANESDQLTGDDHMIAEDEAACEQLYRIRGLPFETSMIRDGPDFMDKLIRIAPAESEKPISLLSEKHFEELSNPDKYPDGVNALAAERPVKLSVRKYFNQRCMM